MRALAGNDVTLEPQIAAHATELYAVLDDPELYRFTDDKRPASEPALADRLRRLESRISADGTEQWLNWVVRNSGGQLVGYVQATIRPGGEAEIAYVFGRRHWRNGYATAACALLLGELANAYEVTRVIATLDPRNEASLALLRRLGFTLRAGDDAANEVTFARDLSANSAEK